MTGISEPAGSPPLSFQKAMALTWRGIHRLEAAGCGHDRFKGKLRREAQGYFGAGGRRAGLVVDDRQAAVRQLVDPVGLGAEREGAGGAFQHQLAFHFGGERADGAAALGFEQDEPCGHPLEPGPPEGPDFRLRQQLAEGVLAETRQLFQRVGGEGVGVGFDEGVERLVDELAALGGTRIGGDGFQGFQPQHAAGVDRVGVAHPRFDLGDGQGARAGGEGRARLGGLDGADFLGAVELFDPGQPLLGFGVDECRGG